MKGQAGQVTDALVKRIIDPYFAEAQKAVAEGIAAYVDLADAGLITK